MIAFLEQIISGISSGSIYASIALALVVTYKSTRVINFAQGAMATLTVYVAYVLIEKGFSYWVSGSIAIVVSMITGALSKFLFENPTKDLPPISKVILALGLLIIYEGLLGWVFTYDMKEFPSPFTFAPLTLGKLVIPSHDLGIIAVTGVIFTLVFLFFQFTNLGLVMRAVAYDQDISGLLGIRVQWMLAMGWGLAAAFGGIAGLFVAPSIYVSPHMMRSVLVYSVAAAIFGGLESPLGALIGGIFIGIVENLAGTYLPFVGPSLKLSVALLIIVICLLFRPDGIFGRAEIKRV